ncbi:MAG: cation-efflux pump [Humidesulfovibrio sp.]|uniref:cation-efflux pump n=1 Tax=Humidesulfovibrio sp. TaxID=2910988 RepID=UPI002736C500|nr:cation-efflux pump [Humidesulfovibrio sp.]MDP2847138.1 cation-efflux pump [Humidesulfovibrio sp.]
MHDTIACPDAQAQHEKRKAALSSVFAALALTAMKLAVGISSGSLGILSEAAHSGLDLVAAGVTLFAVRLSAMPADRKHPFGHGKVENLSALAETLLLLGTCVWIVVEAVDRLLHPKPVEATLWAVGVMVVSIAVDYSRSRMLLAVAKKHNSQALEADALHFSTDIWSSLVVLAGLGALALADQFDQASPLVPWLHRADSLAALAVSGIVLWVSIRLGRQAIDVLLDSGVQEAQDGIERAVAAVPGVLSIRRVRVRQSGPASFVDMLLGVRAGMGMEDAHEVVRHARAAVQSVLPEADVLTELRPQEDGPAGFLDRARDLANTFDVGVHDMDLRKIDGVLHLNLHAEVPEGLSLAEAHRRISEMETALRAELGPRGRVVTHIEPYGAHPEPTEDDPESTETLRQAIAEVVEETPGVCDMHGLTLLRSGARLSASFHCRMHPGTPITLAHERTNALEAALRTRLPQLVRVTIHVEPDNTGMAILDPGLPA